ncbi:hypothetical protein JGU66_25165 [Myxococcaceae bacterium JPH2]|nr:hypothetical protein [Myxococcaceae bacterium JPH2]
MASGTFTVVELNAKHGFALLRPEEGGEAVPTSLYPDSEAGGPSVHQLRVGDRVKGLRRGRTVSEVTWVQKAPPPYAEVERMGELLALLERWELHLPFEAVALAEHHWRDSREHPLEDALLAQLPTFLDRGGTHPYEDAGLLERLVGATRRYLPELAVHPVAGKAAFRVEPGAVEVEAPRASGEAPGPTFAPLLAEVNARLAAHGAPVRWLAVGTDWVLAPPALVEVLGRFGVLGAR